MPRGARDRLSARTRPAFRSRRWPRGATLRTRDVAGIGMLAHLIHNLNLTLPAFVEKMVERKMVGEKAGQGFYKRVKKPDGDSEILTLDPATLEYRPRKSAKLGSLEAAAAIGDLRERVRA